mmetsp:Transcript_2154/g.4446  ORF Transcript_2154/g.4446 Transcript_2154/m.4446 type:complete len:206 (-) Transcript_2154:73-690(-)
MLKPGGSTRSRSSRTDVPCRGVGSSWTARDLPRLTCSEQREECKHRGLSFRGVTVGGWQACIRPKIEQPTRCAHVLPCLNEVQWPESCSCTPMCLHPRSIPTCGSVEAQGRVTSACRGKLAGILEYRVSCKGVIKVFSFASSSLSGSRDRFLMARMPACVIWKKQESRGMALDLNRSAVRWPCCDESKTRFVQTCAQLSPNAGAR